MWRQPLDMRLQKLTPPGTGGRGGAGQRAPQTGSLGMTEKWRWRLKRTRFPGSGLHTDGHMLHCVEPGADNKDGILGSNWQVLASPCGTTSLGTYKTGMRKLRQTHMARPEWRPYKMVEQVVGDAIREGRGSSSVKTILNAAAMAYTMGMVGEPVPKRLWKAFKAAQRLEEKSTQEWGSFEALQIMAHQADSELEWCVVGLAVLSTLLDLRVGEAASISFHRLGVLAGTAEFYDRKVHRDWITRTVSGVALKWLQFCAWIAQKCWNLDQFQRLVSEDKLQNVMAHLLCGSKWKDLRWHAWRRLGPVTMYEATGKLPSIKAWFRWRSTSTAMAYIKCPHPGRIRHPFKGPIPPPVNSRGNHGLQERQPLDARNSRHLRPTISLRGTPRRATLGIPLWAPGNNPNPELRQDLSRSWKDWEPERGLKRPEKGDSGSRNGRTSPTTALREATTRMTWQRAPQDLVKNVATTTGYGTRKADSPWKGGRGRHGTGHPKPVRWG